MLPLFNAGCTRGSLEAMKDEAPKLATTLQDGIMRNMAVSADMLLLSRGANSGM